MSSTPRSILKRPSASSTPSPQGSPTHAVHFPPSPALCRTFAAYSPALYDRTPIVVSKNSCALPERGGRTYVLDERIPSENHKTSRSYHPRALGSATRTPSLADLPQLVPDMSSESDESDGYTPSPQMTEPLYSYGAHGLPTKYQQCDYAPCDSQMDNALSFLPYPPSPRAAVDETPKPRKKRSDRKHHSGAEDLDRIPSTKAPSSRRQAYLMAQAAAASLDDGCLGGF